MDFIPVKDIERHPGYDVKLPLPSFWNLIYFKNGEKKFRPEGIRMEKDLSLRRSKKLKIGIIVGTILCITLFHYLLQVNPLNHQIYGKFYYAPILLAALWFGFRGGLIASIAVDLLLIPHFFLDWGSSIGGLWGVMLEVPMLNLTGWVMGLLKDKEDVALAKVKRTYSFATHEMKNIGISIGGFVKLMKKKGNLPEDTTRFLSIIEKEAQRMERVTKGILHFSRDTILKKESTNMGEFLREVVSISQELARQKGVEFQGETQEDLPSLWLDSDGMKEVLINLVQNAIHATPPGGSIILRAFRNGGNVKIQIVDCGQGIPSGCLNKIFLPFFTTKPEGTGLGLAVSKKIVEAHGASIEVDSREGKGTQFSIQFPLS